MKKRTIRSLTAVLAALCLLTACLSAGATNAPSPIQPRWSGTSSLTVALSMSKSGCASCYGKVVLVNGYTGDMEMVLQRSTNQIIWDDVKTWNTSGSGTLELDKDYYVTSGYYYRVLVTVDVKNTSGKIIESPSDTSPTREY